MVARDRKVGFRSLKLVVDTAPVPLVHPENAASNGRDDIIMHEGEEEQFLTLDRHYSPAIM